MHTPETPHLLLAVLLLLCGCQGEVIAPAQSARDPLATDPVASGYTAGCVVGPVPEAQTAFTEVTFGRRPSPGAEGGMTGARS